MKVDMAATLGQMGQTLRNQNINLTKVMEFAPATRGALEATTKEFTAEGGQGFFSALVREDILAERFQTPPGLLQPDDRPHRQGYKVMFDTLIPQFERQLQGDRRSQADRLLYIAVAVVVLLVTAYLAMGMYYSVLNSIEVFSRGPAPGRGRPDGALRSRRRRRTARRRRPFSTTWPRPSGSFWATSRTGAPAAQRHRATRRVEPADRRQRRLPERCGVEHGGLGREMTVGVDHARNAEDAQNYSRESDQVAARAAKWSARWCMKSNASPPPSMKAPLPSRLWGASPTRSRPSSAPLRTLPTRPTSWPSTPPSKPPGPANPARSFAVVADEVRKLAERTAKSTHEITEMIGSIQTGTATAVSSMKQGVASVATGVDQANQAGQVIHQAQERSRQVVGSVGKFRWPCGSRRRPVRKLPRTSRRSPRWRKKTTLPPPPTPIPPTHCGAWRKISTRKWRASRPDARDVVGRRGETPGRPTAGGACAGGPSVGAKPG